MEVNDIFKLPSKDENKISRIYNGYGYAINYRTETHSYLACIKKSDPKLKCRGRVTIYNGKIKETKPHNHPPDHTLEEKRKLNSAIRVAAQQNLGTFKDCYEKLSKDYPEAVKKQSYKSLARTFRRWCVKYSSEKTMKSSNDTITHHVNNEFDEIQDLEHFVSVLNQNQHLCTYYAAISNQRHLYQINAKLIKDGRYKHLVIYDNELMNVISDARQIIVHKMVSVTPQKCGTHVITIMFEKYEKSLPGFWIIMGGDEEFCYQVLFKYLKLIFSYFNPKQAVVDYNINIQNGLQNAFPNIEIIPSFLHQIESIYENAIRTNAAEIMNRHKNPEKHAILRKFMALSLLPRDYIVSSYNRLITECKSKHGNYFDAFIDYFSKEWLQVWKPDTLSIYRLKYLTKNFLECYGYRQNFVIGEVLKPLSFLEKIKNILVKTRTDLELLEHGEVLTYYLVPEDQDREKKLYKTWDRLDRDLITMNECLVICSNLLNEDFIDTLPDSINDKKKTQCKISQANDIISQIQESANVINEEKMIQDQC